MRGFCGINFHVTFLEDRKFEMECYVIGLKELNNTFNLYAAPTIVVTPYERWSATLRNETSQTVNEEFSIKIADQLKMKSFNC